MLVEKYRPSHLTKRRLRVKLQKTGAVSIEWWEQNRLRFQTG